MRKIIFALSCLGALLLAGYTGYRSYLVWKQSHGLSMAKGYFAKADLRNVFLSLQGVLKANPRNLEACRLMADLLETEHAPGTLVWRQRVVELDPGSFSDRLALAQAAIQQQNYVLATNTLAGVPDADKATAAYHNVSGTAAILGGDREQAQIDFREATRLDPENPVHRVNLAVVSLHQTNVLDMAEARIALQRVILTSTNISLQNQARRELILDAMRFNDISNALSISKELVQANNPVLEDKLLRLEVLMKTASPQFKPTLASYEIEAATNPAAISALAKWQMVNTSISGALDWLQNLPAHSRSNLTVEVLIAGCQSQLKDWHGLQTTLQQENWDDPSHPWNDLEFMRHAYIARSLRGQNLMKASTAEWTVAVKSASDQKYPSVQKGSMKALFELAVAWSWNTEAEQILWTVVNQYPDEKWAFPALRSALINWHRTQSLMQLLGIMFRRDPNNLTIKNDLAATAMLLGASELKPFELAQQVYQKAPKNPCYASTYAYSLYLQHQYSEALKVMQQLNPDDLQEPEIAGYYGLILKANGNKAKAKTYLLRTSQANLLMEEHAIFNQAIAGS